MTLTKLTLEHFGRIGCQRFALDSPVTVFAGEGREDMLAALNLLTGSRCIQPQVRLARESRLAADAVRDEEDYAIDARYSDEAPEHYLLSVRRGTRELPQGRAALFSESIEEEACSYFMRETEFPFSETFARYIKGIREEREIFSERTDGAGFSSTFRRLLREHIRSFEPQPVRLQKRLYLTLDARGNFTARDAQPRRDLSTTERTLLEYLSFLEVNRFWNDVHLAMGRTDAHPLFVLSLADVIDECIDLAPLLKKAAALGRQVFVFSRDKKIAERIRGSEQIKIYLL